MKTGIDEYKTNQWDHVDIDLSCTHLRGFKDAEEVTVSWFNPTTGDFSDPLVLAMERSLPLRSP